MLLTYFLDVLDEDSHGDLLLDVLWLLGNL
jgi:hypothetical protein